jgi:hypothetical protein
MNIRMVPSTKPWKVSMLSHTPRHRFTWKPMTLKVKITTQHLRFTYVSYKCLELIVPAVKGTVGILQSALKHGYVTNFVLSNNSFLCRYMYHRSSVKRIVVTSSCTSILENRSEPTEFSEVDWDIQSVQDVQENGRNASQGSKYRASKTLAEKGT